MPETTMVEKIAKIDELRKDGKSVLDACKEVGIHYSTYYGNKRKKGSKRRAAYSGTKRKKKINRGENFETINLLPSTPLVDDQGQITVTIKVDTLVRILSTIFKR